MNIHQHSCCRLAVVSVLLALAPGAFAQKNIEAAFNSFKKDKAVRFRNGDTISVRNIEK